MDNLIKKILDWADKFFKRFKAFGYIVAVCLGIAFIINNGCDQKTIENLIKTTTGLDVKNDLLLKENQRHELALLEKDSLLLLKDEKIDSINKALSKKEKESRYWKRKHDGISEELIQITGDSSYQFTQFVYDYPGEKKYPYNESQVKGIHKTYLENENKAHQINNLEMALVDCKSAKEIMEEAEDLMDEKFKLKDSQYNNMNKVKANQDEKVKALEKQLNRKTRWNKVKNIGIVALIIGIVIGV